MKDRPDIRALWAALALAVLANCGSSANLKLPAPPGSTVPPAFGRMFVSQCFSNAIFILVPPLVNSQAASATIAQPCTNGLAFNPSNGEMAVTSGSVFGTSSIEIYAPPYSSASVSRATIRYAFGDLRQVAWDGSGNLWVADGNKVYKFMPPFSASSVPAATNTLATQPAGLALNPEAGLMFIGDLGGGNACAVTRCQVFVVPAPYTGAASATFTLDSTPTSIAIDRFGRLFVAFDTGPLIGVINVYLPPFTNDQTPAFALNGGGPIEQLAFDAAGNLYAQLYLTGGVVLFDGPITGPMTAPSRSLGCPSSAASCGFKNWAGIGFGP